MASITYTLRLMSVLFSCAVVLTPSLTVPVRAALDASASFEPPPGRGAPRTGTAGGGARPVRTACMSNAVATADSLTALSPGGHLGLTQSDRPNLFVYLPKTTAQTAEVSLFDEQMNGIYQAIVPVSQQGGLVSISLPANAPTLAQNKPYYWTFALVCNESDRTQDWVVGGWIERAEPNDTLKQQLANLAPVERASLYAKQGFWYDALTTLVELEKTQPNHPELAASWAELMQSVGLDAIATKLVNNPLRK